MSVFEVIENSKVWVCPKSGYYKVITVGGGGGGCGAHLDYATPSIFWPDFGFKVAYLYLYISNASSASFSMDAVLNLFEGFNSTCGGEGGSTSFGSYLTALGGGGGNLPTDLFAGKVHTPKSVLGTPSEYLTNAITTAHRLGHVAPSLGGVGCSKGGDNIMYSCRETTLPRALGESSPSITATQVSNLDLIILAPFGGSGGGSGELQTSIVYIAKGTAVPCTIGAGGSVGISSQLQAKESATISFVRTGAYSINPSISLASNVFGAGGAGGFNLLNPNESFGEGESVGIPRELLSSLNYETRGSSGESLFNVSPFEASTIAKFTGRTANGGACASHPSVAGSSGSGFGAGGGGGSIHARKPQFYAFEGNGIANNNPISLRADFDYYVQPTNGTEGKSGCVIIQEV